MRGRFFWLLVVWTGLTVAGQSAAWGYRNSDPSRKNKVAFELYRDYLIVVRGSADTVKGLNFLLDTGASPTVLDPRVARKLHLEVTATDIAILNGNVQGGRSTVPSLELGSLRRDNLPVLIEDLSFLQQALPAQIDGIVGLDVLGQSAFVVDYASREIRFGPTPSMPFSIPLQIRDGLAIVKATVNHATVHLLLDTGAPSLIVFEETPGPQVYSNGSPRATSKTIGASERKQVRLNSFTLGDKDFGHQPAFVIPNYRDAGHDFDGLMSPAALGITRVAIDLSRGTLAFALEQ
jgi:predicted aspartyl protease